MKNELRDEISKLTLSILYKVQNDGIDALNASQRIVFLIVQLDIVASMEGLFGVYPGMGGDQAVEIVDALRAVGAFTSADLIQRANSFFPGGRPPSSLAELHNVLNGLDKSVFLAINEIGEQFLARPDNLTDKLEEYIKSNLDELACTFPEDE